MVKSRMRVTEMTAKSETVCNRLLRLGGERELIVMGYACSW